MEKENYLKLLTATTLTVLTDFPVDVLEDIVELEDRDERLHRQHAAVKVLLALQDQTYP